MGQRFDNGEALQIRTEVYDRHIDIFQCEANDIERVLRALSL